MICYILALGHRPRMHRKLNPKHIQSTHKVIQKALISTHTNTHRPSVHRKLNYKHIQNTHNITQKAQNTRHRAQNTKQSQCTITGRAQSAKHRKAQGTTKQTHTHTYTKHSRHAHLKYTEHTRIVLVFVYRLMFGCLCILLSDFISAFHICWGPNPFHPALHYIVSGAKWRTTCTTRRKRKSRQRRPTLV